MEDFRREFLDRLSRAFDAVKARGVRLNKAVVFAQAALESDWGRSYLAREANNLFGIKAGSSWRGSTIELPTWEWSKDLGWYKTIAKWRRYRSYQECLLDYYCILQALPWFRDALQHIDNADAFLKALLPTDKEPGWATDPSYAYKVRKIGEIIEKLGYAKWE